MMVEMVAIIIEEHRRLNSTKSTKLRNIRKRAINMCVSNVAMFGCGVVGHALGTLVYPGLGTTLVGVLAELAPMALLN
jgi:hypothetical protein